MCCGNTLDMLTGTAQKQVSTLNSEFTMTTKRQVPGKYALILVYLVYVICAVTGSFNYRGGNIFDKTCQRWRAQGEGDHLGISN